MSSPKIERNYDMIPTRAAYLMFGWLCERSQYCISKRPTSAASTLLLPREIEVETAIIIMGKD